LVCNFPSSSWIKLGYILDAFLNAYSVECSLLYVVLHIPNLEMDVWFVNCHASKWAKRKRAEASFNATYTVQLNATDTTENTLYSYNILLLPTLTWFYAPIFILDVTTLETVKTVLCSIIITIENKVKTQFETKLGLDRSAFGYSTEKSRSLSEVIRDIGTHKMMCLIVLE